jgi:lipid II:glycine glycyltransferase (peptidoglycan interpeptide bridge formation enzyme)
MDANIAGPSEWEEWNSFNQKAIYGNIFQTKEFATSLRNSGFDVSLLLVKEKDTIIGGTFFYIPRTKFIKQMFVVSGPVLNKIDYKALSLILDKISRIAKDKSCFGIQLRTPFVLTKKEVSRLGFEVDELAVACSFKVELTSEEIMWKKLNKKTRNAIRKAIKFGVTVEEVDSYEKLKEAYNVYISRAVNIKNMIPLSEKYFKSIWREMAPNNLARFLIAKYDEKAIAETVFLFYKDTISYFNNASLEKYWGLNANTLIVWEMMKWGSENGYKYLDLYGSPCIPDKKHPKYGLYTFKKGFGGKFVQEMQYSNRIIFPLRYKIFKQILLPYFLPLYKRINYLRYKSGF